MVDRMKEPYTTTPPTNTIFSWEDVIASIGYQSFYAHKTTEANLLIPTETPSYNFSTGITTSSITELNFDHEFLAAADIEGMGFIEFTCKISGDSTGLEETMTNAMRLIHVDTNNNETEIVASLSKQTVAAVAAIERVVMTYTVPNTHFAVGDKLRLEFIITTVETTVGTFVLYHDPANRGSPGNDATGDPADTTLKITIPFKIPV